MDTLLWLVLIFAWGVACGAVLMLLRGSSVDDR
jgi:hypothetical protein